MADLVVRLPEDIFVSLLSITVGILGTPAVQFVTSWVMFGTAVYIFSPVVFERSDPPLPSETSGFKLSFTLGTIAAAIPVTRAFTHDGGSGLLVLTLVLALVSGCLLSAYLVSYRGWELHSEEGEFVDLLAPLAPGTADEYRSEVKVNFAHEGWPGRFARSLYPIGGTMFFSLIIFLISFILAGLALISPFPDIVFLVWAVSTVTIPRLAVGPERDRILNMKFEFDRYLFEALEDASRGLYGLTGYLFLIIGLMGAILPLGVITAGGHLSSLVRLPTFVLSGIERGFDVETIVILWDILGIFFVATFGGLYGVWVWIREFRRFPHFLDGMNETGASGDPPARTTGFVLVPVLTVLGSVGFAGTFHPDRISSLVAWSYAIFWPAFVLFASVTVWHTFRRSWQSTEREYAWIVGGATGQVAVILVDYEAVRGSGFDTGAVIGAVDGGILFSAILILVSIWPFCFKYSDRHNGVREYTSAFVLIILGAVFLYGGQNFRSPGIFVAGAVVCWAGTALLGVGKYYS